MKPIIWKPERLLTEVIGEETIDAEIKRLEENKAIMLERPYPMATTSVAGAQEFATTVTRLAELYNQKKLFKTSTGLGCY